MRITTFSRFANVSALELCYKVQSEQQQSRFRKNRREEVPKFSEHLKTFKIVENSRRQMQMSTTSSATDSSSCQPCLLALCYKRIWSFCPSENHSGSIGTRGSMGSAIAKNHQAMDPPSHPEAPRHRYKRFWRKRYRTCPTKGTLFTGGVLYFMHGLSHVLEFNNQ